MSRCGEEQSVRGVCMMGEEELLEFPFGVVLAWYKLYLLALSLFLSPSLSTYSLHLSVVAHHPQSLPYPYIYISYNHLSCLLSLMANTTTSNISPYISTRHILVGRPQRDIQHTHYHPQIVVRSRCYGVSRCSYIFNGCINPRRRPPTNPGRSSIDPVIHIG